MDNERDAIEREPFAKNQYLLVRFEKNWADEFDVIGFAVFEKSEFEADMRALKEAKVLNDWYFGTNEGWDSDDCTGENWVRSYEAIAITEKEFKTLGDLFSNTDGSISFGNFPWPGDLIAHAEVEDVED